MQNGVYKTMSLGITVTDLRLGDSPSQRLFPLDIEREALSDHSPSVVAGLFLRSRFGDVWIQDGV